MLALNIVITEKYDEESQMFIPTEVHRLELEHSLAALSKWEETFEKPFLGTERTAEETFAYIQCMSRDEIPDRVLAKLNNNHIEAIRAHIDAKHTATWFSDEKESRPGRRMTYTAEVMYSWLVQLRIPFEVQYWHLNKMLTLVRVCQEAVNGEKKMSKRELAMRNKRLNDERRAKLGTSG